MRTALTIAGSDPSGGAGVQADLKTFAALGVYGLSAITAVTAQNTVGVSSVVPLEADLVTAQIETIAADVAVDATKIGMLATASIVEAVAAAIDELDLPLVVVDPVLIATSGDRLLDADAIQTLTAELLPHAFVVTPNIPEAEVLSGRRIIGADAARAAAERIYQLGPSAVIITGGHGEGPEVVDLLFDGEQFLELRAPRVMAGAVHGTGCTYASAIAAGLAKGATLPDAAAAAQRYVAAAIGRGLLQIGKGRPVLNHLVEGFS